MPGIKCGAQAVVRVYDPDKDRDVAVRDATGKPLMQPCRQWAVRGSDPPRCIIHLGDPARRARREATRYFTRHKGELQEIMETLDIADQHPMDGLLDVVRFTGAMMRVMQLLLGRLNIEPLIEWVDGVPVARPELWGLDHAGDQAPHVLMQMYGQWADRHVKACKMALDAGIDERMVRNAEATGATMLRAFEAAVASVTLTDEQRVQLTQAMAREVRAMITAPPALGPGS